MKRLKSEHCVGVFVWSEIHMHVVTIKSIKWVDEAERRAQKQTDTDRLLRKSIIELFIL